MSCDREPFNTNNVKSLSTDYLQSFKRLISRLSCNPVSSHLLTFYLFLFTAGPECSRNFTSNSGVIKSPGFPEKYPNNLDCTFMIFAPKMSEIILEFESFELEPDQTPPAGVFCRYDRLEIWDGFPGGEQSAHLSCPNEFKKDPDIRWTIAVL